MKEEGKEDGQTGEGIREGKRGEGRGGKVVESLKPTLGNH